MCFVRRRSHCWECLALVVVLSTLVEELEEAASLAQR